MSRIAAFVASLALAAALAFVACSTNEPKIIVERGCTVKAQEDGSSLLTCADGSSVVLHSGSGSCTVVDNANGTSTISCPDGTSAVVRAGRDGTSCTVHDNGNGTHTIACSDGTTATVRDGANGHDGPSCTVTPHDDGTSTITCPDGTTATVHDGAAGHDGGTCTVRDDGGGTKTLTCPDGTSVTIVDGHDGASAGPCTVRDDANGTHTIACPDGSTILVKDGAKGSSCSVHDDGGGTKTVSCADGTSITVTDGKDGTDGTSCSVHDNGDGTKTITCTDGTSVTVSDGKNGRDGADGSSCSAVDNGNGTITIRCTNGTTATIPVAGANAPDAGDGTYDAGDGPDYDAGCGDDPKAGTGTPGIVIAASPTCSGSLPTITASGRYSVDMTGVTPPDSASPCQRACGSSFGRSRFFAVTLANDAALRIKAIPSQGMIDTAIVSSCTKTGSPRSCDDVPFVPALAAGTYIVELWADHDGVATIDVDITSPAPQVDFAEVDRCEDVAPFAASLRPLAFEKAYTVLRSGTHERGVWNDDGLAAACAPYDGFVDGIVAFRTDRAAMVVVNIPDRTDQGILGVVDTCGAASSCTQLWLHGKETFRVGAGVHEIVQRFMGSDFRPALGFVLHEVPLAPTNTTCAAAKPLPLSQSPTPLKGGVATAASLYYTFTLPVAARLRVHVSDWTAFGSGTVDVTAACGAGTPLWSNGLAVDPAHPYDESPLLPAGTYSLVLRTRAPVVWDLALSLF